MLILANVVVFVVFWLSANGILLNDAFAQSIGDNFVMYPSEILSGQRLFTLFTSMFMHMELFHIAGNMLYLSIFGGKVEDTFGHASYLVVYIVCGLVAAFAHISSAVFIDVGGLDVGVLGASGAIAGVLGAYLVLYPKSRIITMTFFGFPLIIPIPAVLILGFWFIMQWLYVLTNISTNVAYWSHIGGFITGLIFALTVGLKRKRARERSEGF